MVRLPSIVILPARNIANPTPTSINMTSICRASVAGMDMSRYPRYRWNFKVSAV